MILIVTRLGIIACRYLVKGYYENRYISAPEIADHFNMNVRALMPALRQLTRTGILRSRVGGKEPGFIFAKNPKEVSVYQIVSTLEGQDRVVCCKELVAGLKCDCNEKSICGVFSLFNDLADNAIKKLSAISIVDHAKESIENNFIV